MSPLEGGKSVTGVGVAGGMGMLGSGIREPPLVDVGAGSTVAMGEYVGGGVVEGAGSRTLGRGSPVIVVPGAGSTLVAGSPVVVPGTGSVRGGPAIVVVPALVVPGARVSGVLTTGVVVGPGTGSVVVGLGPRTGTEGRGRPESLAVGTVSGVLTTADVVGPGVGSVVVGLGPRTGTEGRGRPESLVGTVSGVLTTADVVGPGVGSVVVGLGPRTGTEGRGRPESLVVGVVSEVLATVDVVGPGVGSVVVVPEPRTGSRTEVGGKPAPLVAGGTVSVALVVGVDRPTEVGARALVRPLTTGSMMPPPAEPEGDGVEGGVVGEVVMSVGVVGLGGGTGFGRTEGEVVGGDGSAPDGTARGNEM